MLLIGESRLAAACDFKGLDMAEMSHANNLCVRHLKTGGRVLRLNMIAVLVTNLMAKMFCGRAAKLMMPSELPILQQAPCRDSGFVQRMIMECLVPRITAL